MLVLVTAYLGYYLGLRSQGDQMNSLNSWLVLAYLLLGTWATSASAAVLNQVIEKKQDSEMSRTQNRPLVKGSIKRVPALIFGIVLGVSGFLFEPGDIESLVQHIKQLIQNQQLRESMGKEGKLIIEKHFSTKAYAKNFEDMVLRICQ